MMGVYLDILLIAFIVVNITDISGVVEHFEKWLQGWLKVKSEIHIKILECSYCQTHWLCLVYILITGNFNLMNYAYILFICACTPVISDLIWALKDLFGVIPTLINKLNNKLYE